MISLMYNITCSDIRLFELKLKRINLYKQKLLNSKPSRFKKKKLIAWQSKLEELTKETQKLEIELQKAYIDLEKYYN